MKRIGMIVFMIIGILFTSECLVASDEIITPEIFELINTIPEIKSESERADNILKYVKNAETGTDVLGLAGIADNDTKAKIIDKLRFHKNYSKFSDENLVKIGEMIKDASVRDAFFLSVATDLTKRFDAEAIDFSRFAKAMSTDLKRCQLFEAIIRNSSKVGIQPDKILNLANTCDNHIFADEFILLAARSTKLSDSDRTNLADGCRNPEIRDEIVNGKDSPEEVKETIKMIYESTPAPWKEFDSLRGID